MKIHKQILINEKSVSLVSVSARLELLAPARAVFSITGDKPAKGQLLEFNAAFADGEMRRVFLGFVESMAETKKGVYQVVAREFAAILNQRIALNLRHCTPGQILEQVSKRTGHEFVLPESSWTNQTIARFQHIGGGYMVLDSILKLWDVEKGIWQQQTDGRIFVGELEKSVLGNKTIELPANIFSSSSITGGTLPLVPRVRPGVKINLAGNEWVVTSVEVNDDTMRLQWDENPWSNQLRAIS